MNREVQAVVIENDAGVILDEACPTTAAMSAWSPTWTPLRAARSATTSARSEQMPRVMRTQVDVVLPDGVAVLNADDERRIADAGAPVRRGGHPVRDPARAAGRPPRRGRPRRAAARRPHGAVTGASRRRSAQAIRLRRRITIAPASLACRRWPPPGRWASIELMAAGLETFGSRAPTCRDPLIGKPTRWTFPASGPCAAPISGAATPLSRRSSCEPAERSPGPPAGLRGAACARCSRRSDQCRWAQPAPTCRNRMCSKAATLALQAQAGCLVTFSRTSVTVEASTRSSSSTPRKTSAGWRCATPRRWCRGDRRRVRCRRGDRRAARARRGRAPGA